MNRIVTILIGCSFVFTGGCLKLEPPRVPAIVAPGGADPAKGTMQFRLQVDGNDMAGIDISLYKDGLLVEQQRVTLEQEGLPAELLPGGASDRRFGAASFLLAPGKYTIVARPMKNDTEPSDNCLAVEKPEIEVLAGETREVVLVSKCDRPDNGGIDVIVTTNHDPLITGLDVSPAQTVKTCETARVTVTAEDPESDPLTYQWILLKQPSNARFEWKPDGDKLALVPRTAGDYSVKVKVCDNQDLCASMVFPVHATLSTDANGNGIGDECDEAPGPKKGRVVTLLITMSNPRILAYQSRDVPRILIENSVRWVSPKAQPKVLVVRDDNHQNEFADDPAFIHDVLTRAGLDAALLDEPADGLSAAMVAEADVVWFSNPGHEVDDAASIAVLKQLFEAGKGLVLSGDDLGHNEELLPLSHLRYVHDGVSFCNQTIDANSGRDYLVAVEPQSHPVTEGLAQVHFLYGDDIDTTVEMQQGEQALAFATLYPLNGMVNNPPCPATAVIVAWDPNP